MALFVLWCLILLASALPGLCPRALSIASHPPDLWVATAAYLAFRGRGYAGVGWAILLGLVQDALSLDPLGTHGFVLGVVAFAFCEGRAHRPRVEGAGRFLLTFAAALTAGWVYLLRVLPLGGGAVHVGDFVDAFPTALWTTLLASGLYPFLDRYRLLDDLCGRPHGLPA